MAAPNLTTADYAAALGVISAATATLSTEVSAQVERVALAAAALVHEVAPEAPQAIANEAAVRVAAYLFDADPAAGRAPRDVLSASGAASLLGRWRTHRVLAPSGDAPPEPASQDGATLAQVDDAIEAAVETLRQVPEVEHAGRVLSSAAEPPHKPFWDLPLAVVLRALGDLTGHAGDYLRVGADLASIDFGTPPSGGNQSGGADATARSTAAAAALAAAANRERITAIGHSVADAQAELDALVTKTRGTVWADVPESALESHVNPGWTIAADRASAHEGGGGGSYEFPAADHAGVTTFAADADTQVIPTLVVPIGVAVERYRVQHKRGHSVIATYPAAGQLFQRYAADPTLGLAWWGLQDGNADDVAIGARLGDVLQAQQVSEVTSLLVGIDHLAAAVVARLLPAGGSDGQFLGRADGVAAWVSAAAGGRAPTMLNSFSTTIPKGADRASPESLRWDRAPLLLSSLTAGRMLAYHISAGSVEDTVSGFLPVDAIRGLAVGTQGNDYFSSGGRLALGMTGRPVGVNIGRESSYLLFRIGRVTNIARTYTWRLALI
ncbi:MAG: hypothetical protein OXI80_12185 [Caldilineaceae bacterium]|nr:hypothetical protein [Caldilineaceae bacterium]